MAEKVLREINIHNRRFYAPELGKNLAGLEFNHIEALILLSLSNMVVTGDTLLGEEEMFELRKAIEQGKTGLARLELSKSKIKQIEKLLPLFGTVDESVYGPLRIKLSSALLSMDTITLEEVKENVSITGEGSSSP